MIVYTISEKIQNRKTLQRVKEMFSIMKKRIDTQSKKRKNVVQSNTNMLHCFYVKKRIIICASNRSFKEFYFLDSLMSEAKFSSCVNIFVNCIDESISFMKFILWCVFFTILVL